MPKPTYSFANLVLIAILVLFINFYINHKIAFDHIAKLPDLLFIFLSRHVLCFLIAYPIARYWHFDKTFFWLLFVAPTLLILHGFIIWLSEGMLELWPPILFLDILLFVPSFSMYKFGKHHRYEVEPLDSEE